MAKPAFTGVHTLDDWPLREVARYIDWQFLFYAWGLKGKFPEILEHPERGEAARDLYQNAQAMLERIVREGLLKARGRYGFFPANSEGNDIVSVHRRGPEDRADALPVPPSAAGGRGPAEPVSCRLRGAGGERARRLRGRLRGHRRPRRRRPGQALRAGQRRLQRHHGQGARRPPRRGLRRGPPRQGAPGVGLWPGRGPVQRGPHPRALPGHPPGVRLPGVPGPHREGAAAADPRGGAGRASR